MKIYEPIGLWKVLFNGKDSGIRESNHAWAKAYWEGRNKVSPLKIKLVRIG